ncbi:MAG: transaldolase [Oleibacter sp.]|nr:transaldolase [Thalassolituus sp.]
MMSKLDALRGMTIVVADTGDIDAIRRVKPEDATTNPSLILKAADLEGYQPLLKQAAAWAASANNGDSKIVNACDFLAVKIGCDILNIIPGMISTEVDARLSFDTEAMVTKANKLMTMYEDAGVSRERVMIKIASTWEGIKAAEILEKSGIHCNLTLLFSLPQAVACAEAGATLISPFVGRIMDWYKSNSPDMDLTGFNDPGVQSVTSIYNYYKTHGYGTIIMGASFRNTSEIECLAGCDKLTISPDLLEALEQDEGTLVRHLSMSNLSSSPAKIEVDEASFRWAMNEDPMATEKLADGIRRFAADQVTLEQRLESLL